MKPKQNSPRLKSLIFLGTGTSSCVPVVGCLINNHSRCKVCPSSLLPTHRKNRRKNTSALLSFTNGKTILIDAGKTFYEGALQIWPRAHLKRIDALLLTHAHADAMLGLDDLRGWTLGAFIQDSITIYCTKTTYQAVATMFPYMVDASAATGGGDIPQFKWEIIDPEGSFEVCGVVVEALKVEHGRYFDEKRSPFECLGFRVDGMSYISDVSAFPVETVKKVQGTDVLILDALKEGPHASHISIPEAISFVHDLTVPPSRTYLLDFTHDVDHYTLERRLEKDEKVWMRPAYDGLQLHFEHHEGRLRVVHETDLLALDIAEQVGVRERLQRQDSTKAQKSMV